jgi:putative intracellular protease/amidase
MTFSVILYNGFETMDVFGPVEVVGTLQKFKKDVLDIEYYSENGGIVKGSQNTRIDTLPISNIVEENIILIPGGFGARQEINNQAFINSLKELSQRAKYVLTVCTGSALLAKTNLLKNLKATSNKISFDWVVEQDNQVNWMRKARWVNDGKYYTSSGISAGIDMTLGFISDIMGQEVADKISHRMEYIWNNDKNFDPFSKEIQL